MPEWLSHADYHRERRREIVKGSVGVQAVAVYRAPSGTRR